MVILPVKTEMIDGRMSFLIEEKGAIIESNRPIFLISVMDITNHSYPNGKLNWEIKANSQPLEIAQITYGEVPSGFTEISQSLELIEGHTYRVDIVGTGYTSYGEFLFE